MYLNSFFLFDYIYIVRIALTESAWSDDLIGEKLTITKDRCLCVYDILTFIIFTVFESFLIYGKCSIFRIEHLQAMQHKLYLCCPNLVYMFYCRYCVFSLSICIYINLSILYIYIYICRKNCACACTHTHTHTHTHSYIQLYKPFSTLHEYILHEYI